MMQVFEDSEGFSHEQCSKDQIFESTGEGELKVSHTGETSMDHPWIFVLILLLALVSHAATADLNSDKLALLAFAAAVPHGHKLNWNSSSPVCSSWIGITCTPDQTRVFILRLPAVGLLGPIPLETLGKLDALQTLSLRSNGLVDDLPPDVSGLPSIHSIYLQHNNLSGSLPAFMSPTLNFLDLSYNSFAGEIPVIQNITQLTALYLQNNSLSGLIPKVEFPRLKHLNLSYNNLSGSIPVSLQKFSKDSFLGNPFLCGPPLVPCMAVTPSPSQSTIAPSPSLPKHKKKFWKRLSLGVIVAVAAGGAALLLLLAVIILFFILKRNHREGSRQSKEKGSTGGRSEKPKEDYSSGIQEEEKNKLVFFEGCSYNFDLEDLLRASAEVLGKGSYGTTYKAVLEDATLVVVKRLREVVVGKKEFEQQMDMIGRVGQHQNVVPLRAYYYSKDEKLLVYDFVPSGSFGSTLHGNRSAGKDPLDWDSRLKISLGAARGIAHIHAEGGGKFAHGNIKSSNVLLNQELDACIIDFGLALLMTSPASTSRVILGYRAPEVVETRKITQKSDVYSFGVLLLEMLTGKAPIQSPRRDDIVDLPRWVQSVVREEWTAEVFDVELMRYQNIEEEMVRMLQIAMACVAKSPDQRPKMVDVIRMIEEIQHSDSENRPSSERSKEGLNVPTP